MKTLKQWEKSKKDFDEFFKPGDQIDEATYFYQSEQVGDRFQSGNHGDKICVNQISECDREEKGVEYYPTYAYYRDEKIYRYLGILPKMKQPKS